MRRLAHALLIGALAAALPAAVSAQEYAPPTAYPADGVVSGEEVFTTDDHGWTDAMPDDGASAGLSSLNPCPYWYASANALFLRREQIKNTLIVVDDGGGLGTPVLSTGAFDFGSYSTGTEFTLGYQLDETVALEMSYFGLQEWNSSAVASGNNSLSLPGLFALTTADYLFADHVDAHYESKVHNAEFNYKQTMYGLTFLGGFRYFHVGEEINLRFRDNDSGTSDFNVSALNNLYGGQMGVGWTECFGPLTLEVLGKAGVYGNQASVRQNVRDLNNTVQLRDIKASSSRAAFVGEVGFNTVWQVTQWLAFRGGYRVLWLDGIATAPANIDLTDGPNAATEILDRSSILVHGAHVGAELRW
jgi:hypothetical protein